MNLISVVIISLFITSSLLSQIKSFKPVDQNHIEQRMALLIGNSKYSNAPLKNPGNDVKDMANVLRNLGFNVSEYINLDSRQMEEAVSEFGNKLNSNTISLFYFSGHGVQVEGKNYLLPIGANIKKELDVKYEAIDAERVIAEMDNGKSRLKIVILDACRDNPLPRNIRSIVRGLTTMEAPIGTFIAFSTAPGKVSSDGTGRNGLYTAHLLKHLQTPSLKLEDIFKRVRAEVSSLTNGNQTPWENSSIIGDFYFSGGTNTYSNNESKQAVSNPSKFSLDEIDREIEAKKVEEHRIATEHEEKMQAMRDAFIKVQELLKDTSISKQKKNYGKEKFLEYFTVDYDWTMEDNEMRDKIINPTGIDFVWVEGGSFMMGNDDGESKDQRPVHLVTLDGFYISKTEITLALYDKFTDATGKERIKDNGLGRGNLPAQVTNVEAYVYCLWASEQLGSTVRLPSEAEWEYAARGGIKSKGFLYSGSNDFERVAWFIDNSNNRPHEVGLKDPNELGVYDMSGNVSEWCNDGYDYNFYSKSPSKNPIGPKVPERNIRGGSFVSSVVGVSFRQHFPFSFGLSDGIIGYGMGFRVVKEKN